jgi:hypothetical protein
MSIFSKKNIRVLSEFLKNKKYVKGISALLKENPLKMSEFLKNKCFFNEISPKYILIPEKDDFLKGKSPGFA